MNAPVYIIYYKQYYMEQNKKLIKIILLGKNGTGKTSIMNRYVNNRFLHNYKATIGADFLRKDLIIKDREYILQIWDTAGQERFQSLSSAFYRGADGCVFVFDITNRTTFLNLDIWINEFRYKADINKEDEFPIILIGNKNDKEYERTVSTKEAIEWCNNNKIKYYFECSAMTSNNIEKAFINLVEFIIEETDNELYIIETKNVINLYEEEIEQDNNQQYFESYKPNCC